MSLQLFRSIGVALAIAVAAAGCASAPAADSASAAPAGVVAPRAAATEDKSVLNLGGAVADLAADMLNYNLYRHYFPLMALGRARKFLHT